MKKNKLIAIVSAVIMAITLSVPSFAFAQEESAIVAPTEPAIVESTLQDGSEVGPSTKDAEAPIIDEDELDVDTATTTETPASDFQYSITNGEVTITKYIGTSTNVVIPKEIEGLSVKSIGKSAFSACSTLNSVTLPAGLISIDSRAFESCENLRKVTIPTGVTTIGDLAFCDCKNLSSINLPNSVTTLGEYAFYMCDNLSNIIIPISIKTIPEGAFRDSGLRSISIPEGITKIGRSAFNNCFFLTKVNIPSSVITIDNYAFYMCDYLTNLTIEEGVTTIGDYAFSNCDVLSKVKLPCSIQSIGEDAFFSYLIRTKLIVYENSFSHEYAVSNNLNYEINPDEIKATSINLNKDTLNLDLGEMACLTAVMLPKNTLNTKVKWSTDDSKVLNVSENGEVKALKTGKATVTATTAHGLTATCLVTVTHVHNWFATTLDPTCSQGGYDFHVCGRCGDTKKDKETPAKGHSFGQWQTIKDSSCTEEGSEQRICGECGYIESRGVAKKEHAWESDYTIDKDATCTTDGSKSIHCKDCDAVKDSKIIEATGHKYTEWEVVTAPTCEAAGLSKRICTECEIEETLELDKRSHDWKEEYTVDTKATCTEKGSKSIHCRDCEAVKEGSSVEIAIKDHHYGDWTISKPATFGKDGIKKRTCTNCEASDTEELPIPAVVNRVIVLDPCVYDGTEQTPEIIIFNTDGNVLKEGRDYEKTYTNNINAGTGNVTVTLCGDKYEGELTGKFNIAKADAKIDAPDRIKVRTKKSVSLDAKSDSEGDITYETSNKKYATVSSAGVVKGVKVGTATITVSVAGDANHNANTKTVEVIVPTVITKATLAKTSFTYDGEEHVPEIKTVNNKKTLVEGVDYIVSPPEGATDAGTYYVTVTATEDGKYDGSYKAKYTIKKASQTISYDVPKVYVNGNEENLNASTPGTGQITYKSSSSKILKVDAEGNLIGVKAGTAYITMTAPADTNYNKATKKVKVTVYKKDNTLTTEIEPSVTLTVGETLDIGAKATGGTITYSSNKKTYAPVSSTGAITAKKAGTVTITVKAGDSEYNTVSKKITVKVVK